MTNRMLSMFKKKKMISRGQNNEYRADQYLVRRCGGLIYFGLKQLGSPATAVRGNMLFFGDVDCRYVAV